MAFIEKDIGDDTYPVHHHCSPSYESGSCPWTISLVVRISHVPKLPINSNLTWDFVQHIELHSIAPMGGVGDHGHQRAPENVRVWKPFRIGGFSGP